MSMQAGDFVLPTVAAGVDAVVGLNLGLFLDELPEGTPFVHAQRTDDELHAIRQAVLDAAAQAFHAFFGAL